jgi:cytochrome c oxidase assembly factor CtaG
MRPSRLAFLASGIAVLIVALLPPFDAVADRQLSVHMVQHLLIVFVAAPLIVAGADSPRVACCRATAARRSGAC